MQKTGLTILLCFSVMSIFGQKASRIDSIRKLINNESFDTLKIDRLNKIAKYYYHTNPDSAFYYSKKALQISDSIKYLKGKAEAHRIIGIAYSAQGKFNESLKYLLISKDEFEKNHNKKLLTYIYTSIGIVFRKKSDYNTALEYFLKAKEIAEELKDSLKIQAIYNNIGIVYKVIGNYNEALNYYRKSIAIAEKTHKNNTIGYVFGNMALIYKETKNYSLSETYFIKALKVFEKEENVVQIASVYTEMADLYFRMNDLQKSLAFLSQSERILKDVSDYEDVSNNYFIKGKIFTKQKKYNSARKKYTEALRNFKKAGAKAGELKTYFELIRLDSLTGNFKNAFAHSIQYSKLKDSLFSINNAKSIANIQYKYDLLQKENENIKLLKEKEVNDIKIRRQRIINISIGISFVLTFIVLVLFLILFKQTRKKNFLLKKKNEEIKAQNTLLEEQKERIDRQFEEIRNQNTELEKYQNHLEQLVEEKIKELNDALETAQKSDRLKTEFLENLSHEIRTPLNAVVGFTEIYGQNYNLEEISPDFIFAVQKSMDDLLHTVNRLVVISRYQVGEYTLSPKRFNLVDYFRQKKEQFIKRRNFLHKEKINLVFELDDLINQEPFLSDESVLDLIITELIENAFKFTNRGTITISAKILNKQLYFSVKDTGMGIKKEAVAYIFDLLRKFDDDNELFRGMGVGLAIVKKATELLSGTITVETVPDNGAEFRIVIPEISLSSDL